MKMSRSEKIRDGLRTANRVAEGFPGYKIEDKIYWTRGRGRKTTLVEEGARVTGGGFNVYKRGPEKPVPGGDKRVHPDVGHVYYGPGGRLDIVVRPEMKNFGVDLKRKLRGARLWVVGQPLRLTEEILNEPRGYMMLRKLMKQYRLRGRL